MTGKKYRTLLFLTIAKYVFSFALVVAAFLITRRKSYALLCFLELAAVFLFSDILLRRRKTVGRIVNGILLLLFNVECGSLIFAGTFVTYIMITNVDSLDSLRGKAVIYILLAVLAIVFSFLPAVPMPASFSQKKKKSAADSAPAEAAADGTDRAKKKAFSASPFLAAVLAVELLLTMRFGSGYSPFYSIIDLYDQHASHEALRAVSADAEAARARFRHPDLFNGINRPEAIPPRSNIVLIMAEGLSRNIVTDERDVAPFLKDYESRSIHFTNYYNHTFATYRGIIGQLYSGFQLDNYDTNSLVSMQSILHDQNYYTSFINAEPRNLHFTQYLESLGFDAVISPTDRDPAATDYLSDRESYDVLFNTLEAQKAAQVNGEKPFFTVIYTYATHLSFDSPDEKFGDGSNALLNKFYNTDHWFGMFMDRFEQSDLFGNTVVVFTTDHATYADDDYTVAFPNYERQFPALDEIPFFIYYKGVEPMEIDAGGRNSLDMAPTVLDIVDTWQENYFLGTTLFVDTENNNDYDTVYFDSDSIRSSAKDTVHELDDASLALIQANLRDYFAACRS